MPAAYFWKCDCGIQWRGDRETGGGMQLAACFCERRHEIPGNVSALYYSSKAYPRTEADWKDAPHTLLLDPDERNVA
jgi:hypothetical protein